MSAPGQPLRTAAHPPGLAPATLQAMPSAPFCSGLRSAQPRSPLHGTLRIIPFLASPSAQCPRNIVLEINVYHVPVDSRADGQTRRITVIPLQTQGCGLPDWRAPASAARLRVADERGPAPCVFRSRTGHTAHQNYTGLAS